MATPCYILLLWVRLSSKIPYINEIIWYLSSCVCLISFSFISSRFIHGLQKAKCPSFSGLNNIPFQVWTHIIHSSVNRHFSSVQSLSRAQLFATPWTVAHQASLSNSQSLPKLMSIESVMPFNHLILCCPFSSSLQSFPTSGSFPMSQLFASLGQNIGVSASTSILPMNTQDFL